MKIRYTKIKLPVMSNLQTHYHFKLDLQTVDQRMPADNLGSYLLLYSIWTHQYFICQLSKYLTMVSTATGLYFWLINAQNPMVWDQNLYYFIDIFGRELGPSGVSPNQRSRWKHTFSPLKHV